MRPYKEQPVNLSPTVIACLEAMANENYTLDQVIEGYCNAVLKEHLQNRTHAADQLGISVRTFQRWLRRWAFKNNKMPQQLPTSNMTVLM